MQRYFTEHLLDDAQKFEVDDKELAKHVVKVLRMKINDEFELVDSAKNVFLAKIIESDGNKLIVKLSKLDVISPEFKDEAVIVAEVSKGNKIDFIIQKGTEMGATEFILYNGDYSVAKIKNDKIETKLARYKKIAKQAAMQSHRLVIPSVKFINNLIELADHPAEVKLVAYEEEAKSGRMKSLKQQLTQNSNKSVMFFFGSEGGISLQEIATLKRMNFITVGLGPRILRAETAPLYALAALSYEREL